MWYALAIGRGTLPISNNLGQLEDENPVVRVEPIDKPTPVPPTDNGVPADGQTKS